MLRRFSFFAIRGQPWFLPRGSEAGPTISCLQAGQNRLNAPRLRMNRE